MKNGAENSSSVKQVLAARRSCRNYKTTPIDPKILENLIDQARRTPTAGNSQGVEFLVLNGEKEVAAYWDTTLDKDRRDNFPWPGLLLAPALVIPYGIPERYLSRYQEIDKKKSGLGESIDAWPIPYWIVDASSASTALQLLVVESGMACCFFGQFEKEEKVSQRFSVPREARAIGTIAIGWAADDDRSSISVARTRRPLEDVLHVSEW